MTGSLNVGPRVMITRAGPRPHRTDQRRQPRRRALPLRAARAGRARRRRRCARMLKQAFPEATIADYRETHPIITRGLDRATTFLSLIALIALVIGAMGVASAMHGHLQQKLDSIAVMKCIGARSAQVIRIYTAQTLMLGLAGGVLGVVFGVAVAAAFPGLDREIFQIDVAAYWDAWPALQGIAVACLVTLLFTLPPLLRIRDIRPALVFRRDVDDAAARPSAGAGWPRVAILLGTGAGRRHAHGGQFPRRGAHGRFFTLALAIGIALLSLTGWASCAASCGSARAGAPSGRGAARHRESVPAGNQSQAAVVALGVGVMFTLTVFLVQKALVRADPRQRAAGNAERVSAGHSRRTSEQASSARSGAARRDGSAGRGVRRQRAHHGDRRRAGRAADRCASSDRRFLRTRSVTEMDGEAARDRDPERRVVEAGRPREPQVCVTEEAAKILRLKPGSIDRLEHLEPHRAHARGVHRAHRIDPAVRALRVHLQSRTAGGLAGGLLRQRARAAGRRRRRCSACCTSSSRRSPWSTSRT